MSPEHFEVAVVGGGKGGKTLAADLARSGRRVALIERGMIGGSCINIACIPTKTMVRSAKVAELTRRAAEFGVRADFRGVDIAAVRDRKRAVVADLVKLNRENFDKSGMALLIGTARFTGHRAVEVQLADGGTRNLTADHVVINTGTRPAVPDVPGIAAAKPLNSESIQELDRLPDHLVVLGGGYIGLEFAQMFRRFGSRVTVIDRNPQFLPREDPDVAEAVLGAFRAEGIDVRLGAATERVEGESGKSIRLALRTPAGPATVEGTDLLVAPGRKPNTEELNLAAAGVAADERGFVVVGDRLETTATHIWAAGDVTGGPQFTHISFDDYRVLKANLTGGERTTLGRQVPYALFTDPELGRVGLTETEARKRGHAVRVAKLPAKAIPRTRTSGEPHGLLKAVIDADTDRILGAAVFAAEGGEVIAAVQVAMLAGLPFTALRDAVFSHPTMTEGLNDLFARVE